MDTIEPLDIHDEPLNFDDFDLPAEFTDELEETPSPATRVGSEAPTPTTQQVIAMERATRELISAARASLRPAKKGRDKSPTTEKISIRISASVLDLIKQKAARAGVRYQTFINQMITDAATGAFK